MPSQKLDGDSLQLTEIVSYLECWDALQLSLVAHSVHIIAKYHALRYASIDTYDGHIKFCQYMLNGMRHRLLYIHTLEVSFYISNEAQIKRATSLPIVTVNRYKPASALFVTVNHYKAAGALFAEVLDKASNLK